MKFLVTASLCLSATTSAFQWELSPNWKDNCGGDGYKDIGTWSQGCTNIYLRNGLGDVSTLWQLRYNNPTKIGCTVTGYSDQYCGGRTFTHTGYSRGSASTSYYDRFCQAGFQMKSYKVNCWNA
jgi:hypothetical protein